MKDPDELEQVSAEERQLEADFQAQRARSIPRPASRPDMVAGLNAQLAAPSVELGMPVVEKAPRTPAKARRPIDAAREAPEEFRTGVEPTLDRMARIDEERIRPLISESEKLGAEYQKAVDARTEYRAKIATQLDNMDVMAKKLASQQPLDAWAEAPTWLKITSIAAMSVGAAAQAYYGDRTNAVADQIDSALKRDLMFQKMRLEKGQDDFKNKNLLLRQFMDTNDHIQNAEDKAYVTALNGIVSRMEMTKNLLTEPKMRQNMEQNIAELKLKGAETQARIMENVVGRDARMALAAAQLEARRQALENERARIEQADMREERLRGADERVASEYTAPHVRGTFKRRSEAKDYTEAATQANILINGLSKMDKLLASRKLTDINNLAEFKQLGATLELQAKGKDVFNLGAALTYTELERLRNAMGTGDWTYFLTPIGRRTIQRAAEAIAEGVETRLINAGVEPDETHPFLSPRSKTDAP